jgi:NitT/TauT family transport system substrate-binding protein
MTFRTSLRVRHVNCCRLLARLAFGCAVLAISTVSAAAQGLEKVTLRLDYLLNGYHGPFFLALDRGYYKQQGIDLQIFDGRGSTTTFQVVASGVDTFGLANLAALPVAISKGVPLIAIGALIQKSPDAVLSLAGRNINIPKDLEGKRGAFVPTGAGDRLFPAFAKANNIDLGKISNVSIASEARFSVLLQGNADFVVAWALGDAYRINKQRPIAPPMLFADHGVPMLGTGLFITKDTAANRPALVKRFMAATVRGVQEAIEDPAAAVASTVKFRSDGDPGIMLVGMMGVVKYIRTPNSANMPLLAMAKADWDATTNNLVNYLGLSGALKSDAFYTNAFLPSP